MEKILESLCKINSVSGHEQKFIKFIASNLQNKHNYIIDNLGNLIITQPKSNVLITTAVDEIGLLINKIESDGSLRFLTIGKVNSATLVGSIVNVNDNLGVIGQKPIHLQTKKEKNSNISSNDLFIDIGSNCKENAKMIAKLGDVVTFQNDFYKFGEDRICSKSINSKVGSAILVTLLNLSPKLNANYAFLTKSVVTPSSYATSTNKINPTIAILIDTIEEFEINENMITNDKDSIDFILNYKPQTNQSIFNVAINIAKKNNLKFTTKVNNKISDNEKAIMQTKNGVQTINVLIPCRQINSTCSNVSVTSLKSATLFIQKLVEALN